MKGWIKTGLWSVVMYVIVFLFNYFFLRGVPDNILIKVVNAPVYFLLQLFGVVSAGIVFYVGVLAYFSLGVVVFFIARCLEDVTKKHNFLKEDDLNSN